MNRWELSEDEIAWRGFLFDADAQSAMSIFGGRRAAAAKAHWDHDIAYEAWCKDRTVVTSNGNDFISETAEIQKRDRGTVCPDAWGLIIIPNQDLVRQRVLPGLRHGVRMGGRLIRWPSLAYANLCIKVCNDGHAEIKRFKRCLHCERHNPIEEGWDKELPVIVGRQRSSKR